MSVLPKMHFLTHAARFLARYVYISYLDAYVFQVIIIIWQNGTISEVLEHAV